MLLLKIIESNKFHSRSIWVTCESSVHVWKEPGRKSIDSVTAEEKTDVISTVRQAREKSGRINNTHIQIRKEKYIWGSGCSLGHLAAGIPPEAAYQNEQLDAE